MSVEGQSGASDDRLAGSKENQEAVPDFYPDDPTDSRKPGDWKTRYKDPESQKAIRFERNYLFTLLFLIPLLIIVLQVPRGLENSRNWLQKQESRTTIFLDLLMHGSAGLSVERCSTSSGSTIQLRRTCGMLIGDCGGYLSLTCPALWGFLLYW